MTDPNDLANPVHIPANDYGREMPETHEGLTKREKFAESAMVGLLASLTLGPLPVKVKMQLAVECADELIEQLNKDKNDNTKKD